jgi:hypothetical protein
MARKTPMVSPVRQHPDNQRPAAPWVELPAPRQTSLEKTDKTELQLQPPQITAREVRSEATLRGAVGVRAGSEKQAKMARMEMAAAAVAAPGMGPNTAQKPMVTRNTSQESKAPAAQRVAAAAVAEKAETLVVGVLPPSSFDRMSLSQNLF